MHFAALHCLSVQRVWSVLIFLLTFFIKEKSEAPPAGEAMKQLRLLYLEQHFRQLQTGRMCHHKLPLRSNLRYKQV
ncbi:hypothetical protein OB13_20500 [Pontibacter sp. HJ8]